jgi:hypothetical protein
MVGIYLVKDTKNTYNVCLNLVHYDKTELIFVFYARFCPRIDK